MTEREAANGLIELQTENTRNVNDLLRANALASHWLTADLNSARAEAMRTARKILRLLTQIRLEWIRISPTEFPEAARLVRETKETHESRIEAASFKDLQYTVIREGEHVVRFVPLPGTTAYVL